MLRSPLLPILLTVFVDVLGLTLMLPLLPLYAESFGASPFVAGLLIASYSACQLISGPILGRLSDRVGRKPVLLASQMGTFGAFLTIGFAHSLPMLFLGRIIDGLTAGNLTTAQAYISDVTKPEERTKAFALVGIAFGVGFLLGPPFSSLLHGLFDSFAAPAFAAAALSLTSIVFTQTLLPNVKPTGTTKTAARTQAFSRFFSLPGPRQKLLTFFAFSLSFSTLLGGLALFLERRFMFTASETGWIYGFAGLVGAIIQGGLIGRLVKRLGEPKLALVGFVTMAIGYSILGLAFSIPMLLGAVALSGFGSAVVRPSLTTLITNSVGRDEQGAVLGVSQSLASIAQLMGAPMAGFLIGHGRLDAYGLTAGSFALIGILMSLGAKQPSA